jgi:hypothetical protein
MKPRTENGCVINCDLVASGDRQRLLKAGLLSSSDVSESLDKNRIWIRQNAELACQLASQSYQWFQDSGDGFLLAVRTAKAAHIIALGIHSAAHKASKDNTVEFRIGIATDSITYRTPPDFTSAACLYATRLQEKCNPGGIWICPLTWKELATSYGEDYEATQVKFEVKGEPFAAHPWRRPPALPAANDSLSEPVEEASISLNFVDAPVIRTKALEKFMDYTRTRNIVFALGGEGGGLNTFLDQFHDYLEQSGSHHPKAVDFSIETYRTILSYRREEVNLRNQYGSLSEDKLELKCLFAALAYQVCHTLAARFDAVRQVVHPTWLSHPVQFQAKYFADPAMQQSDPGPIIRYFFEELQKVATEIACVGFVVFMPLETLASCFSYTSKNRETGLWEAAWALWNALESTAECKKRYDKICLVVGAREFPYGHMALAIRLVGQALWCIPPLDTDEVESMMTQASPHLSGSEAAKLLADATGGSPWITRVVLSFIPPVLAKASPSDTNSVNGMAIIRDCVLLAENAIKSGGVGLAGALKLEIANGHERIETALGDRQSDDTAITSSWRGMKRDRSFRITNSRIEAFVASGLVWFEGDPWDIKSENHVFAEYPYVRFRKPSRIAIAAYERITNNNSLE